jgi:signal transduction histidine kinase
MSQGVASLRLRLSNPDPSPRRYVIAFQERALNSVKLVQTQLRLGSGISGAAVDKLERDLPTMGSDIAFELPALATSELEFHITSHNNMLLAFELIPLRMYGFMTVSDSVMTGSALAVLFALLLYSASAALSARQGALGWFAGFLVGMIGGLGTVTGLFDALLPIPAKGGWASLLGNFSLLAIICALRFSRLHLRSSEGNLVLVWVTRAMTALATLNFVFLNVSASRDLASLLVDILIMALGLVLIAMGVYASLKKEAGAKTFLIAWLLPLVGVIVLILRRHGYLQDNLFTLYSLHLGVVLMAMTISLSLSRAVRELMLERNIEHSRAESAAYIAVERQRMLRILSHDISNPLFVIGGFAQVALRDQDLNPKQRKILGKIAHAAHEIEEVISLTRHLEAVDSGKAVFDVEPVALQRLVEHLRKTFDSPLNQKNLRLSLEISESLLESEIMADRRILFHCVISNLISNAMKFSLPDGVITFGAERCEGGIRLSISDHGVGMPPDLLKNLFDPTAQTSRTGTQGEVGTGFGLPIVYSFVTKMGGVLEVESQVESQADQRHGTSFHIVLPAA